MHRRNRTHSVLVSIAGATPQVAGRREISDGDWWRDAVVYQIYVRSFADGNGDGVGDLPGVISRLEYLRSLDIDAIWLTPFYPSPLVDGGYDVADYRNVEPRFGTLEDFDTLVAQCHRLGLRIIVDIVANHTSDQHPWFQEALRSGPNSPARDRYIFRDGRGAHGDLPPTDWNSWFSASAWERVEDGQWYLHLFDRTQPDLNWITPTSKPTSSGHCASGRTGEWTGFGSTPHTVWRRTSPR